MRPAMLALVTKALTRPAAGPIATSAALIVTAALAVSLARAGQTEGELKAQVAALAAAARANSVAWRTQLDSCRSELAQAKPPVTTAITRVTGGKEAVAEALAGCAHRPPPPPPIIVQAPAPAPEPKVVTREVVVKVPVKIACVPKSLPP